MKGHSHMRRYPGWGLIYWTTWTVDSRVMKRPSPSNRWKWSKCCCFPLYPSSCCSLNLWFILPWSWLFNTWVLLERVTPRAWKFERSENFHVRGVTSDYVGIMDFFIFSLLPLTHSKSTNTYIYLGGFTQINIEVVTI